MAYYQQHGNYGPPQQPMYGGGPASSPPNYHHHMANTHAQHPQGSMHHGGHGGHPHPNPLQQHLKRQASQLRTQYPDTRWCAVFVDYATSKTTNEQKNDLIDENELLQPIQKTDTSSLDLTLEQTIMNDVMTYQDRDADDQKKREEARQAIEDRKEKARQEKERKENDMIGEFINFTGISDKNRARIELIKADWDLQKAVGNNQSNFSSPNVLGQQNKNDYGNFSYNSNGSELTMILPSNERMTLSMTGTDTIWGVYAKLLQKKPEISQKPFTFQLSDGHKLNENEFDKTLNDLNLVPNGEVRVVD